DAPEEKRLADAFVAQALAMGLKGVRGPTVRKCTVRVKFSSERRKSKTGNATAGRRELSAPRLADRSRAGGIQKTL
ncbi:hypothetical protein QIG26_27810, partial [Klebsiella pneumoniae]|nr:hypothetical protein [Klebsiella pneumoniae]